MIIRIHKLKIAGVALNKSSIYNREDICSIVWLSITYLIPTTFNKCDASNSSTDDTMEEELTPFTIEGEEEFEFLSLAEAGIADNSTSIGSFDAWQSVFAKEVSLSESLWLCVVLG